METIKIILNSVTLFEIKEEKDATPDKFCELIGVSTTLIGAAIRTLEYRHVLDGNTKKEIIDVITKELEKLTDEA